MEGPIYKDAMQIFLIFMLLFSFNHVMINENSEAYPKHMLKMSLSCSEFNYQVKILNSL